MAYSWVLRTLVKLYPIKCFFNLKDMITVNKETEFDHYAGYNKVFIPTGKEFCEGCGIEKQ